MANGIGSSNNSTQYEIMKFRQRDNRTGEVKTRNISRFPSPTVAASGIGDSLASPYWLEPGRAKPRSAGNKPPYRVPSMAEIAAAPKSGYSATVVWECAARRNVAVCAERVASRL